MLMSPGLPLHQGLSHVFCSSLVPLPTTQAELMEFVTPLIKIVGFDDWPIGRFGDLDFGFVRCLVLGAWDLDR